MNIKDLKIGDWFQYGTQIYTIIKERKDGLEALCINELSEDNTWIFFYDFWKDEDLLYLSSIHLEQNKELTTHGHIVTLEELPSGALIGNTDFDSDGKSINSIYAKILSNDYFCIYSTSPDLAYKIKQFDCYRYAYLLDEYNITIDEIENIGG